MKLNKKLRTCLMVISKWIFIPVVMTSAIVITLFTIPFWGLTPNEAKRC